MRDDPEQHRHLAGRRRAAGRRRGRGTRFAVATVLAVAVVGAVAVAVPSALVRGGDGAADRTPATGPGSDDPGPDTPAATTTAPTATVPTTTTTVAGPPPLARLAERHPQGFTFRGALEPQACDNLHATGRVVVTADGDSTIDATLAGAARPEARGRAAGVGPRTVAAWATTPDGTEPIEGWLVILTLTDAGTLLRMLHAEGPPASMTAPPALEGALEQLVQGRDETELAAINWRDLARAVDATTACVGELKFPTVNPDG